MYLTSVSTTRGLVPQLFPYPDTHEKSGDTVELVGPEFSA